jgi:hypothetical protein
MTRLRTIAVWLTAVMTMAAGLPQMACACPGRPATPPETSTVQACQCGGGCCANSVSAKCCDGERGPVTPASRESGRTVCKKGLIAQQAPSAPATTGANPSSDSTSWTIVSPNGVLPVPSDAVIAAARQLPSHAPPTDLLLLLQHFLI